MPDFWPGRRTLVTGGAGFLGRHLVDRLRARGAEVFVVRRREYDLLDKTAVSRLLAGARPQLVIHAAAVGGGIGEMRTRAWVNHLRKHVPGNPAVIIEFMPGAGGQNHDGTPPPNSVVLELEGLTGTFTGGSTAFALPVDSGNGVGNGVQVRVSYDFDGDGTHDREEVYPYFATDDVPGWETYTHGRGPASSRGSFADLDGGTVRVEIWSAIGGQDSQVRVGGGDGATLSVPFTG